MNHHLLNKILLWHFALCNRPLRKARSIMVCDKQCASCTTLHLRGMNGIRWVILGYYPKPPGLPGITAPWFVEVGQVILSGNQWGPSPMLAGMQNGEYTDQSSVWTAFDLSGEVLCEADWEGTALYRHPVKLCSRPIRSSGTQCKSPELVTHGLCPRYDVVVFLQQFLWMASTDPRGVWGEYANPLKMWFLGVAHYVHGSRRSQSLVGDTSTTELLCVALWNIWCHLQCSSWFTAYQLCFLCRQWWDPSKIIFVGMKCFCNDQITSDYRSSDAWFN